MTALIELTGVNKAYGGNRESVALASVSIAIPVGEAAFVMGPSGSGKSTLLNLIGGLDRPSSGSVRVDGQELNRMGEGAIAKFRRSRVGIVFQFFNLLNNLSSLENVLVPAQLAGANRAVARRRALDLFDRLEIAELRDQYPMRLSGGQRQRVAIARALINDPVLLLADEPTGALDTHNGRQVMAILSDLNRGGQTLVLVTHDERLARANASRVIELVDGAVKSDRSTSQLGMVDFR